MKEWKVRHKLFHMLYQGEDLGDDLSKETIIFEEEDKKIIQRALEYPVKQTKELYYPGKSYAVAIIFAKLLELHFNENFYEVLDDESLLYENDPYFKKYSDKKEVYDNIIKDFPFELLQEKKWSGSRNAELTIEYFLKEFLLHEDTKHLLAN